MHNLKHKAQGEIFGVALLFVVIIVGIILSSQMKLVDSDNKDDPVTKGKYELLAQSSLETILKTTTKCNVDGHAAMDTIQDLISTCLARANQLVDPMVDCPALDDDPIPLCQTSLDLLNESLEFLYNGSDSLIGNIPYSLYIELPRSTKNILHNKTLTNFGTVKYKNKIINESNYQVLKFNKASSDLKTWATAQRTINMDLALYYK